MNPLVRSYLSSVEREAAALPTPRREELVADLREHIEISLAESGRGDDAQVRDILNRLGSAQEVVRAALEEEPVPPLTSPESRRRTAVTLTLALLPVPLYFATWVGLPLALATGTAAVLRLRRSTSWTPEEKREATRLILSPLLVLPLTLFVVRLLFYWNFSLTLVAAQTSLILPMIGAARLARSAKQLRDAKPGELPAGRGTAATAVRPD
ncbi:HAAS signaling domain-containing protein [Streptomyces marincola]|uniref:HAAS signaling domain-containing protein n=1 Tax=Streptomyces marincola TaxID=2878388 RepID=UPI001CF510BD|nr:hypothetical protein [Streptomyces marincola]UCM91339.1 hypothetical protein LC193_27225 [Streptomyces marincola]